jgi:hypothetical protein
LRRIQKRVIAGFIERNRRFHVAWEFQLRIRISASHAPESPDVISDTERYADDRRKPKARLKRGLEHGYRY